MPGHLTSPQMNYDSAQVAPQGYLQAAAFGANTAPAPQYQPASAAEFAACQLPLPTRIRVPQTVVRKHEFPVLYTTYSKETTFTEVEAPITFQKIANPPVMQDMCETRAQRMEEQAPPFAQYSTCSKSTFNPTVTEAVPAGYGAPYAAQYGSYASMI